MLGQVLDSWVSLYAGHGVLRTAVEFAHIGGLLAGGGCAIAADLATITAAREGPGAQAAHLQLLRRTHRIVALGLVALAISGLLLFATDVETFVQSRVFWLKMGLFSLLLGNGALLLVFERQATRGDARAWTRLHRTAAASLTLWVLTTLAGAALPNLG